MDRGTFVSLDGRPAVRFTRGALQPHVGGTIEFSGDPQSSKHLTPASRGTILEYDPPHRLAYTWRGTELHFRLDPAGQDGCVLTLINVLEARDEAARNAAGWSVCLAELDKLVAGAVTDGPHAAGTTWREFYDSYVAAGLPAGAAIPSEG